MIHSILLYGVNLSRLPKERVNLPQNIRGKYNDFKILDLRRLTSKEELDIILLNDYQYQDREIERSGVYIGQRLKSTFTFEGELELFDVNYIIEVLTNNTDLLSRLNKIGIGASQSDLALYSSTEEKDD